MFIYLAGGMRSGWQDRVIEAVNAAIPEGDVCFLDPRKHGLGDPEAYTEWDISNIVTSCIVLAYLEKTNPGGANMALELGYAKGYAKGRRLPVYIIVVDEKQDKYFSMMRTTHIADVLCTTLEEGIQILITLITRQSR